MSMTQLAPSTEKHQLITMDSFQNHLKEQIGPKGYAPNLRRSVQSAVLFEAQRCVQDHLVAMRPFQRKIAFFNQFVALLDSLNFILPQQRHEIMWRTATSKETMTPENAWKRSRLVDRELAKLAEKIKPHMAGKTHQEACDAMLDEMYESFSKEQAEDVGEGDKPLKPRPTRWEHSHNNAVMTFRMYYKGDKLNPDLPPPIPAVPIVVPSERPSASGDGGHFISPGSEVAGRPPLPNQGVATLPSTASGGEVDIAAGDAAAESRRKILKEVTDHLDILKQFEGVIPTDELNRRKRDLYLAMPPAPPHFSQSLYEASKRAKL